MMVTNKMDIFAGWESPGEVERSEAGESGKYRTGSAQFSHPSGGSAFRNRVEIH